MRCLTGHLAAAATAVVVIQLTLVAKAPSLDDVVQRLTAYVERYGPGLAAVVAEEHYTQWVESEPGTVRVPRIGVTRRVIRSDFVLTRLDGDEGWVAFRDAFEVDGTPLRDREERLVGLLSAGGDETWRRAAAIANESSRFNIGSNLITRNINVPTFALQLLSGRHRQRFTLSRSQTRARERTGDLPAAPRADGEGRWEIEFRERDRPTLVRQRSGGGDQPLRGTISVDPDGGEVWRTHLTWERGPGGYIDVTFARVPGFGVLVPVRMVEAYRNGPTTIRGEAMYSNFRRFETSSRVVQP